MTSSRPLPPEPFLPPTTLARALAYKPDPTLYLLLLLSLYFTSRGASDSASSPGGIGSVVYYKGGLMEGGGTRGHEATANYGH